jgi:7,8-dihydroneopterin aldolase/epimerase/oxygenase
MSATIILRNLRVQASIGVYPHEKHGAQTLKLDMELTLSSVQASVTDRLRDTVDYDVLIRAVQQFATREHQDLLERFTYDLAQHLLANFPLARADITAWKNIAAHAPTEIAVRVNMQAGESWRSSAAKHDEDERYND